MTVRSRSIGIGEPQVQAALAALPTIVDDKESYGEGRDEFVVMNTFPCMAPLALCT